MAMKTIGLVGGMTPESTKAYYELLIRGARQPGGDPLRNPEIIIFSLNLTELVQIQLTGERRQVVEYLAGILERLRAAGAKVGALTANTPHAYLDEIRAETSLPLVSIVSATRDAAGDLGRRSFHRCARYHRDPRRRDPRGRVLSPGKRYSLGIRLAFSDSHDSKV
jgi:aspartate racemase